MAGPPPPGDVNEDVSVPELLRAAREVAHKLLSIVEALEARYGRDGEQ